tara:strand:+ start:970 stop:1557 length:588 start_codon:yes stop_codon:yes gene_type:complete
MAFWTEREVTPKFKDRFVLVINGKFTMFVKTVTKPTLTFDNKEYKMINHYFKYPGLPKWNTITVTFVDMNGGGNQKDELDACKYLLSFAENGKYSNPTETSSPSKKDMVEALGEILIQQISTDKTEGSKVKVTEQWKLINPIIRSINWGDLAYGSDEFVEYTLELDYDYAEHSSGQNIFGTQDVDTEQENGDTSE